MGGDERRCRGPGAEHPIRCIMGCRLGRQPGLAPCHRQWAARLGPAQKTLSRRASSRASPHDPGSARYSVCLVTNQILSPP